MPDVCLHHGVVDDVKANEGCEEAVVCQGGTGGSLAIGVVTDQVTLLAQPLLTAV